MGMRTMLTRLAGKLDLPTDIAAGLPRIALNCFSECSLDRHRGILEYSTERIVVALNLGELTVEGQTLELRQMHRERLCITGRIERLSFGGAGCCGRSCSGCSAPAASASRAEVPSGPSRG